MKQLLITIDGSSHAFLNLIQITSILEFCSGNKWVKVKVYGLPIDSILRNFVCDLSDFEILNTSYTFKEGFDEHTNNGSSSLHLGSNFFFNKKLDSNLSSETLFSLLSFAKKIDSSETSRTQGYVYKLSQGEYFEIAVDQSEEPLFFLDFELLDLMKLDCCSRRQML